MKTTMKTKTKTKIALSALVVGLVWSGVVSAAPVVHKVWDKTPLNITLPVGEERMVSFPAPVKFGYDQSQLPAPVLRVINNNATVYLTAHKAFAAQPVEVLLPSSGHIILLNLSAQAGASDTPIEVVLKSSTPTTQGTDHHGADTQISPGQLIRFAVQQLYAPTRLLKEPAAINRVPMELPKHVPLLLDGSVTAEPLISWQSGNSYVTDVQVYNTQRFTQPLHPQAFCGQWLLVGFYPRQTLAPEFQPSDNTTVILVSKVPFGEALADCEGRE